MNQTKPELSHITQMADIFLPEPPQPIVSDEVLFIVLAIIVSTLIMLYLQWFNAPLIKLKRHLKQGKLSPRETIHHLAQLLTPSEKNKHGPELEIRKKIDLMRFQRQPPNHNEVLSLINSLQPNLKVPIAKIICMFLLPKSVNNVR